MPAPIGAVRSISIVRPFCLAVHGRFSEHAAAKVANLRYASDLQYHPARIKCHRRSGIVGFPNYRAAPRQTAWRLMA